METRKAVHLVLLLLGPCAGAARAAVEYTDDGESGPREEQFRWYLNRARYAPESEGDRLLLVNTTPGGSPGFDVCEDKEGANDFGTTEAQWQAWKASRQPLAPNGKLAQAAGLHSRDMAETRLFQHNSPSATYFPLNSSARQRHTASGYANGLSGYFENIATASSASLAAYPAEALSAPDCLRTLWIDAGIPDRSHRKCMLSVNAREIGVGFARAQAPEVVGGKTYLTTRDYYTQDLGLRTGWHFFTDTLWHDADHDGVYDLNEGVAGVEVRVYQDGVEGGWYDVSSPSGNVAVPIQAFADGRAVEVSLVNSGDTARSLTLPAGYLAQGDVTLPAHSTLFLGRFAQPGADLNRGFRDLVPEFGFAVEVPTAGEPRVHFQARVGQRYQVEACTDLLRQDWVRIQDVTAGQPVVWIDCPVGSNCGFLRVGMVRD